MMLQVLREQFFRYLNETRAGHNRIARKMSCEDGVTCVEVNLVSARFVCRGDVI